MAVFTAAYAVVASEEKLLLRKSVPMLLAAGLVWGLVALGYAQRGGASAVGDAARHNVLDFAELFLFLVVAMTYVNTMTERGVFDAVRAWLVSRGLSLRALFWVTGALAFVMSPFADNLTTALVMGAVATAVAPGNSRFVALASTNVVVAANAGGVFSPFGDVTTLMVWQKGVISFAGFFPLVVPALVNWLVPATLMSLAVGRERPRAQADQAVVEAGARTVVALFVGTIAVTVAAHSFLRLPPALGMMFGLGILQAYSYIFNFFRARNGPLPIEQLDEVFATTALDIDAQTERVQQGRPTRPLYPFQALERVEWDTLMFFYGVVLCVGGLDALGYLALVSQALYTGLGPTVANVLVGLLSAAVDNVPVMFAVLSMELQMSQGQWLLVTLTAGVGGSLLSFGSAAGVALMGQARGTYTFLAHLRWAWAIALGYAASIAAHLVLNGRLF